MTEEINNAAGAQDAGPETSADEAKTKAVAAQAAESDAQSATANDGDDEQGEQPERKRLGGWQRKNQKLERENELLREMLVTRREPPKEEAKPAAEDQAPTKPVRPLSNQFDDYGKYEAALAKYDDDLDSYFQQRTAFEAKQANARQTKEAQQKSEQQQVAERWNQQVATARQQHADFDEVAFSADVPMSQPMMEAIVTSEIGALIAYELGDHPEEAERISKLGAVQAIREIGKIEARLAKEEPAADQSEQEAERKAAPPQSKAPPPPSPVRRTGAADRGPRDDQPWKAWLREREAEIRSKQ